MSQSNLPCADCEGREAGACGTCPFHRVPQDDDEMIYMWEILFNRQARIAIAEENKGV